MLKTVGEQQDERRRLSPRDRHSAEPGRSVVEPRQPQDRPLRRGRHRGDGGGARASPSLTEDDRFHLHFALGKALEDRGDSPRPASPIMPTGNRLRRASTRLRRRPTSTRMSTASIALFTPDFFAAARGWGCPAPDPIFILGLPRAGSTLIEQILASHPPVEGTMELPDIPLIARRRGGRRSGGEPAATPIAWPTSTAKRWPRWASEYLERARRSSAIPTGPCSSTSCPTTGRMSG